MHISKLITLNSIIGTIFFGIFPIDYCCGPLAVIALDWIFVE
jgi:hypothetical protein